ncbi:MAG TPA: hypothetical protein VGS13_16875 [Stellaceae bacterium]|nr:hypothetical protein [Stellaceae bacterium]
MLAVAAAAAAGYVARAIMAQPAPATTAAAPTTNPGTTPGVKPRPVAAPDKPRDTVVWRDEAGTIYRAKVADGRFDQFLRERVRVLEAARNVSREQAVAEISGALKPIFASMTARVPRYADWYFAYTTKYELMAHALMPALDTLGRDVDRLAGQDTREGEGLVRSIGVHMVAYLEDQYAEQVVRPRAADSQLQAAFDKSYDDLEARWARIVAEQRGAMRAFIKEQAGSAERLSADQARGLKLDWDGKPDNGTIMHKERMVEQNFRQGLLSVTLKIPKSVKTPTQNESSENNPEEADVITHVIVNLFDKVVGPIVSQMGDLAIGIFAGGAASGTTVGFGMTGIGAMGVTTGVATAVPLGAAIGLAATIAAEMLSNQLEASLSRTDFEDNIKKTVDSTENTVETKMIAVLDQHIEAWYADIANPVRLK